MKTILAALVASLTLAIMAFPAMANAATVQVFSNTSSVTDNQPENQWNDHFTVIQVDAWTVRITNTGNNVGQPLQIVDESAADGIDCVQETNAQIACVRGTGGPQFDINLYGSFGNDTFTV